MIPKKINYCWLSNDPIPEKLQRCIDSWKKYLPDYEIIKWDLNRFPLDKNIWVKQAFERKKYAFAADYIRLYALSTEGGIYMDSDVEVLKSFDPLLSLPYFICKENSPQGVEAAVLGAEAHTPWVDKCLEYYNGRSFIDTNGNENTKVLPVVMMETIKSNYDIKWITSLKSFEESKNVVNILPYYYFSPKNYVTKKITLTDDTFSIHHFAGTWIPFWKKMLLYIWVPFSVKFPKYAKVINRHHE